jgi:L-fucose isomerase
VGQLKNKAYVSIGSVSMGIGGSFLDPQLMQDYFNIRAEWVDMSEIIRRVEKGIYDKAEYEKELAWIKANCKEGKDLNPGPWGQKEFSRAEKDKQWEFTAKMTLIIKDIMLGNDKLDGIGWHEEALGRNAIAGGFQGQRMWTDFMPNADFPEAILNSTFDHNGKKEPIILATENDNCNGMAMLFSKLLSGRASAFADVRTYWSPEAIERVSGWAPEGRAENGLIHLINSGAAALDATGKALNNDGKPEMKRWWEITDTDIKAITDAVKWSPANKGYFRGGGYSSTFETKVDMPVTLVRVNMVAGLGYTLQIAEGWTVALPEEVSKKLWDRTDPTWPCTWFVPCTNNAECYVEGDYDECDCDEFGDGIFIDCPSFDDVYSVMAAWGANHGAFTYGHIGADLITLASMLRINVTLHNVPQDEIYRPHSWFAFGTRDLESADYRACQNYGPLYK